MPIEFDLPEVVQENVEVIYFEDEEINFEDEEIQDAMQEDDIDEVVIDMSILTFKLHTRSVFRLNFNNSNTLVVSGSQDDLGLVWNVATGEVILVCSGHKDSVTEVCFTFDDKYLATGDMSGIIQVWDIANKALIWCFEGDELEWLMWHHSAYILLAGTLTGNMFMWQIFEGKCKVFPSNGFKTCDAFLLPNGLQLISGYENGNIRLWDLKTQNVLCQIVPEVFNSSMNNLKPSPDGNMIAMCGSSAGLVIFKTSDLKIVSVLKGTQQIETAAFCPEPDLNLVASGNLIGEICIWDLAHQILRHKISVKYTVTQILWGPNATLFASSSDSKVYVFNGRTGELITKITGHTSLVLDMKLSKDKKFLITCSDDKTAKVFDIEKCLEAVSVESS